MYLHYTQYKRHNFFIFCNGSDFNNTPEHQTQPPKAQIPHRADGAEEWRKTSQFSKLSLIMTDLSGFLPLPMFSLRWCLGIQGAHMALRPWGLGQGGERPPPSTTTLCQFSDMCWSGSFGQPPTPSPPLTSSADIYGRQNSQTIFS